MRIRTPTTSAARSFGYRCMLLHVLRSVGRDGHSTLEPEVGLFLKAVRVIG